MNDAPSATRGPSPWHLWVIGAFFLVLYAIGAYDYVQTRTQDAGYFDSQGYGPAQIAYFADYPVVPLVFWTVNIATGLGAGVLLLLRSRWAVLSSAASVLSMLCLDAITFGFMNRWNALGPRLAITDICILLLTVALYLYCHRMRRENVLGPGIIGRFT